MKRVLIEKVHACNKMNFGGIVNEVNRAVLNPLFFFFYEKISHSQKAQIAQKAPKAHKAQRRIQTKAQKRK